MKNDYVLHSVSSLSTLVKTSQTVIMTLRGPTEPIVSWPFVYKF